MCFVFFYLFLIDYPLIQILIHVLSFFLGGAVNGEFHGVKCPEVFCFVLKWICLCLLFVVGVNNTQMQIFQGLSSFCYFNNVCIG